MQNKVKIFLVQTILLVLSALNILAFGGALVYAIVKGYVASIVFGSIFTAASASFTVALSLLKAGKHENKDLMHAFYIGNFVMTIVLAIIVFSVGTVFATDGNALLFFVSFIASAYLAADGILSLYLRRLENEQEYLDAVLA